jgi:hypothetical protein
MTHALPYPNLDLVLTEAVATSLRCEPGREGPAALRPFAFPDPDRCRPVWRAAHRPYPE